MKNQIGKIVTKYLMCAAVIAGMAWLYVGARDFAGAAQVDRYRMLCDAFTIPGVVLVMVGALVWVGTQGALDGISYCVRFAVFSLIPGKRLERDEKYGEYVQRKTGNRTKGYGFLFLSGGVALAVAGVYMALYYSLC